MTGLKTHLILALMAALGFTWGYGGLRGNWRQVLHLPKAGSESASSPDGAASAAPDGSAGTVGAGAAAGPGVPGAPHQRGSGLAEAMDSIQGSATNDSQLERRRQLMERLSDQQGPPSGAPPAFQQLPGNNVRRDVVPDPAIIPADPPEETEAVDPDDEEEVIEEVDDAEEEEIIEEEEDSAEDLPEVDEDV